MRGKKKAEDPKTWKTKILPWSRVSGKEKIIFFKYLAVMTEAGIPVDRALAAIHAQTRSPMMHRVLHIMLTDVASGEFLSTSLKKMPHLFDPLLTNMVTVGETSGTLTSACFNISDHLEKTRALKGKIRSAFVYPGIVVTGTLATTAYMLLVLLPQLMPLFSSLNVKLPLATVIVITASNFLIHDGIFLAGGAVLLAVAFFFLIRIESFHYAVDSAILHIPVVGPIVRKMQVTLFSRILTTLLRSGTTIVEAFTIASNSLSNRVYRRALKTISGSIQEGENVSTYLAKHGKLFSPLVTQMVSVGEETGKLDGSFEFIANFTERELDEATKTLTTILEPLLMIFIGALVGLVAIAIITPIYSLTSSLQR